MNKEEFAKVAMALKTYYSKETKLLPNEASMSLWFDELKDIDYKTATLAVRQWVHTHEWSPTISQLREEVAKINNGEAKDWGEAWEGVCVAIRKYGSYSENEALESLEPITRQAVKRLGFKNLCMSENAMADRANFRMIYEQLSEREANKAQLPEGLLNQIEAIQKGKELEHDEKERRLLGG